MFNVFLGKKLNLSTEGHCIILTTILMSIFAKMLPVIHFGQKSDVLRMRENTDQKNSEYGHFSQSECLAGRKKSEWETPNLK